MGGFGLFNRVSAAFADDPLMGMALAAALFAMATTPIAFAILGRLNYFETRRGRTLQKPTFSSVVAAMILVGAIPAIFCAIVLKSRHFDEDRYAYDPNKTWSVLDQGRGFRTVEEADEAVREEMGRLGLERKNLVDRVKKLDESMLVMRAAASRYPDTAKALSPVLERLAGVRASVGVDAPQQLIDATAAPAALAGGAPMPAVAIASAAAPATTAAATPVVAAPAPAEAVSGLTKAAFDVEVAAVPASQQILAAMLPLVGLPAGWEVADLSGKHIETFNAENLYEKIDGRAESFVQYDVKGMAYASFHPVGDDSADVQLYIFEMGGPLKAMGKYGSEKPEGVKTMAMGTEGYSAAGSTLFYAGPYYTQIVSTKDDPAFAAFALDLARKVVAKQTKAPEPVSPGSGPVPAPKVSGPEAVFALLPEGPKKSGPKFVPQDVFGYSFLSDVFMADYEEGDVKWQGFLRPYASPAEAKAVFEKYLEGAKQDGSEVRDIPLAGVDRLIISANFGLFDAIFLKGNSVGGANGATKPGPVEAFSKSFAEKLPPTVAAVGAEASR